MLSAWQLSENTQGVLCFSQHVVLHQGLCAKSKQAGQDATIHLGCCLSSTRHCYLIHFNIIFVTPFKVRFNQLSSNMHWDDSTGHIVRDQAGSNNKQKIKEDSNASKKHQKTMCQNNSNKTNSTASANSPHQSWNSLPHTELWGSLLTPRLSRSSCDCKWTSLAVHTLRIAQLP